MKLLFALFALCLTAAAADTLFLTWTQPPGYSSALYSSTNLNGPWTQIAVGVAPPVEVGVTNQQCFFFVNVAPTNEVNNPMIYINNPNDEGLKPKYTNQPCMAYDENDHIALYLWNITRQIWN